MTARHLIIGLDGADLDLVLALGPERLPNLHAQMRRGMFAACQSVMPPATLPNWTTFLTGVDPGLHGVFDFTTRVGYRVRFTAGTVREVPTFLTRLDRQHKRCACVGFPATWPPEQLEHGVFISGWDAPVAFESDASFVWPTSLHAELVRRFGPQRFDDVDELNADAPGWHDRLPDALCERIDRRLEMATWLLDSRDWDVFALYFGESDTAAHHLWALHDPRSPRHPHNAGNTHDDHPHAHDGLARVYQQLDAALGALLARAGGNSVEITVISDHGSGGSSDKVLYLNRVLAQAGFLTFKPARRSTALMPTLKQLALRGLPPKLRERVFRAAGAALPGWLESQVRFGAIEMSRTRAFSDELNYFPAIHWNLRGRDPQGTLDPADVPAAFEQLRACLLSLRDPWSQQPVIAAVHRREELYSGPWIERAPDVLLELHLDDGYSYNLMPTPNTGARGSADNTGHAFRRLLTHEHQGRKGRSLAGSHRPRGLFIAAGPSIANVGLVNAHIVDASFTTLQRIEQPLAAPLTDVVRARTAARTATPTSHATARESSTTRAQESRVEARLRALGYIE